MLNRYLWSIKKYLKLFGLNRTFGLMNCDWGPYMSYHPHTNSVFTENWFIMTNDRIMGTFLLPDLAADSERQGGLSELIRVLWATQTPSERVCKLPPFRPLVDNARVKEMVWTRWKVKREYGPIFESWCVIRWISRKIFWKLFLSKWNLRQLLENATKCT